MGAAVQGDDTGGDGACAAFPAEAIRVMAVSALRLHGKGRVPDRRCRARYGGYLSSPAAGRPRPSADLYHQHVKLTALCSRSGSYHDIAHLPRFPPRLGRAQHRHGVRADG